MKKSLRWLPALVVPVVVVAGALAIPAVASADPNLPAKTPQQVLAMIADSTDAAYSGEISQSSDLGLPELPAGAGGSAADATGGILELLSGSHDARVFVGSPTQTRLQVLDRLAERDAIRNGDDVWLYDSTSNEVTHATLPADAGPGAATAPTASATTPAELADMLLASIDDSTDVEVTDTARVAGRPAYELTVTPTTDDTLVGSVALSVDSATGLPLSVVVTADGQKDPAFQVAFTSIDFTAPDASRFEFTPPTGATVTEQTLPGEADIAAAKAKADADAAGTAPTDGTAAHPRPVITGEGWASIVELAAPTGDAQGPADSEAPDAPDADDTTQLLDGLTTKVAGGRALQTTLISVLLLDDGRVLAGAVPLGALVAAAAG